MKRITATLAFLVLMWAPVRADINAIMGVAITTASTVMGITPISAVMGQTVTAGGGGTIALIASGSGGSSDTNNVTSSSFNSTGANFIVGGAAYYLGVTPTVTDSKSNSYTTRTVYTGSGTIGVFIFYKENATVGSGHTVTLTGTGGFPSVAAAAFSNVKTATAYDTENGASGVGLQNIQPGSITAADNDELFITVFNGNLLNETVTTSGTGWVEIQQVNSDGATHVCITLSYKIQTTAGSENPTITWSSFANVVATQANFKKQ